MNWTQDYQDCLNYIDSYWNKIIFKPAKLRLKYSFITIPTFIKDKKASPHTLYVPNSFFVPNLGAQKKICYWDTFFMFRGIMGTKREWIMKDMVENFRYIFNQFQIIPNLNTPAAINRSQPPFLTSMIRDIYFTPLNPHNPHKVINGHLPQSVYHIKHKKWLKEAVEFAKKEYELVWIDKENYYNHSAKGYTLSRYGDRDIGYAHSSEIESGWDMTSRFYNRCDHFLPIDLNSYLHKYEKDFAFFATFFGNNDEAIYWEEKAAERAKSIQNLMWDTDEKFFYDYGHYYQKISHYFSLASFAPLWAGIATAEQAQAMVKRLPLFESPYGLMIGAKESLPNPIDLSTIQQRYHDAINDIIKRKQWDYPNIWSPLEYITIIGLLRYGYIDDAKRIMQKSIKAHATVYRKYHTFFEKLDGETGEKGKGALYGDQDGFGWTNAIFYRYIKILDAIDNGVNIYEEPKSTEPPYNLTILH